MFLSFFFQGSLLVQALDYSIRAFARLDIKDILDKVSLIVANYTLPNGHKQTAAYEARGFFHKLKFPRALHLGPSRFVFESPTPTRPRAIKRQRNSSKPAPSSPSKDEDNIQVQSAQSSLN